MTADFDAGRTLGASAGRLRGSGPHRSTVATRAAARVLPALPTLPVPHLRPPRPHWVTTADEPADAGDFGGQLSDAYQVVGPADAPAIVFVHATRLDRAMWRSQVVGLADRFRVVTLDLPGHGALADRPFRLRAAVEQVARIVDEAAAGRAIVVGISIGGYVAMELAARHPERVAGLMLCGATCEPWAVIRRPEHVAARLVLTLEKERHARWTRFLPHPLAVLGGDRAPAHGIRFDGGTQALLEVMGLRFRARLARYPGETLIVNGARDRLMRRHESLFLQAARQGALVVLPDTGHLVNREDPARFNGLIRRFADSI